jgi:hypothetical protein
MKLMDVLETVAWGEKNFGAVICGGNLHRRDMTKAIEKGFVKSAGFAVVVDDDGFQVNPERHREGFVLTDAGKKLIEMKTPIRI